MLLFESVPTILSAQTQFGLHTRGVPKFLSLSQKCLKSEKKNSVHMVRILSYQPIFVHFKFNVLIAIYFFGTPCWLPHFIFRTRHPTGLKPISRALHGGRTVVRPAATGSCAIAIIMISATIQLHMVFLRSYSFQLFSFSSKQKCFKKYKKYSYHYFQYYVVNSKMRVYPFQA